MRLLSWTKDGGKESSVDGLFLIELKPLFSVVLLRFGAGSREAFHSHAFNALTIWLRGMVTEHLLNGFSQTWKAGQLKWTPRSCFHRIVPETTAWAISFRGPWVNQWREFIPRLNRFITLTHGRREVR